MHVPTSLSTRIVVQSAGAIAPLRLVQGSTGGKYVGLGVTISHLRGRARHSGVLRRQISHRSQQFLWRSALLQVRASSAKSDAKRLDTAVSDSGPRNTGAQATHFLDENTTGTTMHDKGKTEGEQGVAAQSKPLLALPAAGENTTTLDMSGGDATAKLDHLGPLVVNTDGTLARVANWAEMSDIERENTMRILGKRNKARLAALRAQPKPESE